MTMIIDGTAGVTFPVVAGGTSAVQASSGKVLQVVSATTTSSTSTSSTSFVSTSLTASITPSSSSSKIFILVAGGELDSNGTNQAITATIYRNSTNLAGSSGISDSYGTLSRVQSTLSMSFLDSPSTTSSTTYTAYIKAGSGTVVFNANPVQSCITLMEIAA